MKCCKYLELNNNSCGCILFECKCYEEIECWCCFINFWNEKDKIAFSSDDLIKNIKNILKYKSFPKLFRKGLSNFLDEIEKNTRDLSELDKNLKFDLNDYKTQPELIYNTIEITLITKLIYFINKLDLYIEICNLIIEINEIYEIKISYLDLFNFSENIEQTILILVNLFSSLSKNIENGVEYTTLKNKMINFDSDLLKFRKKLHIKIVNYK